MIGFFFAALRKPFTRSAPEGSNLVERARVEALYRRYWFQVERRCKHILGNSSDAADAAQEVFVKLLTKGNLFRGEAEWMTWLYRVGTNVCLNRMRNQRRRGDRWLGQVRIVKAEMEESSVESLLSDRAALKQTLERSDETTRQIAVHYFFDQMTQEEIGTLMGLSRVTVNKRLGELRARLDAFVREVVEP